MDLHSRSMSNLRPPDIDPESRIPVPRRADSYSVGDLHISLPPKGNPSKRSSTMDDGTQGNWLRRYKAIDIRNLTDDRTPPPTVEELYEEFDRIDFSAVFGPDGPDDRKFAEKKKWDEFEDDMFTPDGEKDHERKKRKFRPPEHLIRLFALRLALIEKTASGLGTLAFLWATVVILGGFATTIDLTDFWVVTVIIFAEGSRIFSRSHELEWRQLSTRSNGGLTFHGFLKAARSLSLVSSSDHDHRGFSKSTYLYERARSRFRPFSPHRNVASWGKKSPNLSPPSADSDRESPTNSTSSNSRHNRYGGVPPIRAKDIVNNTVRGTDATVPLTRSLPLTRSMPQLLPYVNKVLSTQVVHWILYIVQLVSALSCIGLSLWRLSKQKFAADDGTPINNVKVSMNVFYLLSVLEAGLFLLERGYWEYRYRYKQLLKKVRDEGKLGEENKEIVKQFFYDGYAACLSGSVFDALNMDLVEYCISWLQTEVVLQQQSGARLLNRIVSKKNKYASSALRRLGTTTGVIERLVEMLSWKDETELLRDIADIVCRLVRYNRNCSRFVAVPGSTDAVVSLLYLHARPSADFHEADQLEAIALRLAGLRTLKFLCIDHRNCLAIGETRSLLPLLMMFIEVRRTSPLRSEKYIRPDDLKDHFKIYKKSLQVLRLLARAPNTSGTALRERIASIVSGLTNLRDVIEYGKNRPELQLLCIDILFHLAIDEYARDSIGATGGLIRNLFHLFMEYGSVRESSPVPAIESESKTKFQNSKSGVTKSQSQRKNPTFEVNGSETDRKVQNPKPAGEIEGESEAVKKYRKEIKTSKERIEVSEMAGKALTRLVLRNEKNCLKLLQLTDGTTKDNSKLIRGLVSSLDQPEGIASSAAKILRTALNYVDDSTKAAIARGCEPMLVKVIFEHGTSPKSEMYEASLGLASRALVALDMGKFVQIRSTVNKLDFVLQLIKNLQHTPTTNKFPRIRRYSLELILALIAKDASILDSFQRHKLDLKAVLENTLDSIAEVENFCLFSGLVGHTRHLVEMEDLVKQCIGKVDDYYAGRLSTSSSQKAV